ncbi:MAG: phosphoribosylanthranilate isomerase [Pseudomonadota bacterium]
MNPVEIKICGLSREDSIDAAIEAGASHIGLVHFPKSPRHVSLERAAELRAHAGKRIRTVLLLVNTEPALTGHAIVTVRPDIVQFHGSEKPEWLRAVRERTGIGVWKAVGLRDAGTLERSARYHDAADLLLFDAPARALPGGTGASFDWSLLADHQHQVDWGLAGGLSPENVGEALAVTNAPLVDVSSGVESAPGVKDMDKIHAFCQAVRDFESSSRSG